MTRSFGDKIGAKAGVICDPGIINLLNSKTSLNSRETKAINLLCWHQMEFGIN